MQNKSENKSKIGAMQRNRCSVSQPLTGKQQDPEQKRLRVEKVYGQTAFTLIELLVVVLIVGILAAIAVPQYQKAVDRTKLIRTLTMLNNIDKAQEAYYMANGKYSTDWAELELGFEGRSNNGQQWFELARLYAAAHIVDLPDILLFWFYYQHPDWSDKRACYAKVDNNYANELCKNLSGKTQWDVQADHKQQNVYLF